MELIFLSLLPMTSPIFKAVSAGVTLAVADVALFRITGREAAMDAGNLALSNLVADFVVGGGGDLIPGAFSELVNLGLVGGLYVGLDMAIDSSAVEGALPKFLVAIGASGFSNAYVYGLLAGMTY